MLRKEFPPGKARFCHFGLVLICFLTIVGAEAQSGPAKLVLPNRKFKYLVDVDSLKLRYRLAVREGGTWDGDDGVMSHGSSFVVAAAEVQPQRTPP